LLTVMPSFGSWSGKAMFVIFAGESTKPSGWSEKRSTEGDGNDDKRPV